MKQNVYPKQKMTWEKPLLVDLGIEATRTGILGTSADFLNYDPTSPSATNTDSS